MAENDQDQNAGLSALAVPPAPAPNLGGLLAAFGNMELVGAPAPQAPAWAPQPYDPAAVLADMPDLDDGRGGQQQQAQLQQAQPQFAPQTQQARPQQQSGPAPRSRRGRSRPEPQQAQPEPEPEELEAQGTQGGGGTAASPSAVITEVIRDLEDLADDLEEDDELGDAAAASADGFKAIWQVLGGMQQNIMALAQHMETGGGGAEPNRALVTPPPGAMTQEEAIAVQQGILVGLSFFELVTGDVKAWNAFVQALPAQTRAMLRQTSEQLPALAQQAIAVVQERTGVSLGDIMRQIDPAVIQAEAKKHGITLPAEALKR